MINRSARLLGLTAARLARRLTAAAGALGAAGIALLIAGASAAATTPSASEGSAAQSPKDEAGRAKPGQVVAQADHGNATSTDARGARPVASEESAVQEHKVTLANRTVAVFRGSLLGVGPERRARRAESVLRELASQGGEGKVSVKVEPQGHALLIDGELAFLLVPGDTDRLHDQTLAQVSRETVKALQLALDETREVRDFDRILSHAALAALATAIAGVIIALTWRARRWATTRLAALMSQGGTGLTIGGAQLVQADRLASAASRVTRMASWLVVLAVAYQWLGYVFTQFPYTRPWGEGLTRFLVGAVSGIGKATLGALPDLSIAVLILFIARGVIALARPVFVRAAQGHGGGLFSWLDADTALPTQRIFTIAVVLFALVMAYPYLPGSDSEAFKGMSVLVGLMLTLGGSNLVGQASSGLVIMYSRTLRVGEYVRIDNHEGTVTKLGAFTTRIRTGLGEELTLPNSVVTSTVTKNYSRTVRGRGYVVDTVVTIGYDTPWRQVEAMLIEAARRTPGVLPQPAPRVFQTALSDFYPEYRLVCQASPTEPRPRAEVLSVLHAHIQDVFNEHDVQIMSPHYLGDPASAKVVARADWFRTPARPPGGPAAGG